MPSLELGDFKYKRGDSIKRLFLLLFLLSNSAYAQTSAANIDGVQADDSGASSFSLMALSVVASNLRSESDPNQSLGGFINLIPFYSFGNGMSMFGSFSWAKDFSTEEKMRFQDSFAEVILGNAKITDSLSYSPRIGGTAATNSFQRDQTSEYGSAFVRNMFIWRPFTSNITLQYSFRYRQFFHEFESNATGSANIENQFRNQLVVSYGYKSVFLTVLARYNLSQTYNGNYLNGFFHTQEISYALPGNIGIGVGHQNGGNVVDALGRSNVEVFDQNSSQVYAILSYSY